MKAVTNRELIEYLQTLPLDLPVIYKKHSEAKLLILEEVQVTSLQPARPDGWVHDIWGREEALPTIKYILFPGN